MYRILSVFLVLLLFCGCSKQAVPPKKDTFTLSTTINYLGNEYKADIFASAADVFKIEFTAPEKIKGLCFNWDTQTGFIEYKKLQYKFTATDAPEIFSSIKDAFTLIFLNTGTATLNANDTFTIEKDGIRVELDKGGTPILITADGIEIKVDTKSTEG